MSMDKLKELLSRIDLILIRERTMEEERRKRGENFNVFSVLGLSQNETRLHSAFIAELLNPDGSHGLKDAFLKSFVEQILPDFEFVTDVVKVETEKFIGQKNEDSTCGGRIDLIITNSRRQALIIENKIGASEQEKQLERYSNYAKENFSDYRLLFLTLEGSDSITISDEGKGQYKPVSYRTDILKWLESCIGIAACYPLIRETIRQYIINLKEILNIMDTENENKLIETATSKEYVDSALTIIENGTNIKKAIRERFVEQLKELVEKKGLEFHCDEGLCDLRNDSWIMILKPSVSKIWSIYIGWEKQTKGEGAYYGIGNIGEVKNEASADVLNTLPLVWKEGKQSSWWPCGWAYLRGGNGSWWDWTNVQTLRDMVNGNMLHFIETEIIDKVLSEHLLEKVQKAIPEY